MTQNFFSYSLRFSELNSPGEQKRQSLQSVASSRPTPGPWNTAQAQSCQARSVFFQEAGPQGTWLWRTMRSGCKYQPGHVTAILLDLSSPLSASQPEEAGRERWRRSERAGQSQGHEEKFNCLAGANNAANAREKRNSWAHFVVRGRQVVFIFQGKKNLNLSDLQEQGC